MREILDERKKKEFESFEDLSNRVPALSDPVGMIANRVKQELDTTTVKRGKLKYYLFTPIPRNNSNRNKK